MASSKLDLPVSAAPIAAASQARPFSRVRVWVLALTAGLFAGFAAWLIGEVIHGRIGPPTLVNISGPGGGFVSAPEILKLRAAKRAAQTLDTTLVFGTLGAILGLALGLGGGYARGSARAAMNAAIAGTVFGAIVGAAATQVMLPVYYGILNPDTNDLSVGFLFHIVISSAIGAVAGAAFGAGLDGRRCAVRVAVGGLLGAALGVLAHQTVGALAYPLAETTSPISATWGTRLLARLAVTILVSVGAALGAVDQARGSTSSSVSK